MHKFLCAALLCAACSVIAQDDAFLKGEELKAAIEKDCSDGCILFNRDEAQDFQDSVERFIAQRERAAYEAGVQYQKQACRSLI